MAEERLRREAERCLRMGTLTFLFSIDGGTSGLASALLQGARDDYPTSTLLQPHFVAPAPPGVVGETRARLQELKTTANFGRRGKRHINNSHSQASGILPGGLPPRKPVARLPGLKNGQESWPTPPLTRLARALAGATA